MGMALRPGCSELKAWVMFHWSMFLRARVCIVYFSKYNVNNVYQSICFRVYIHSVILLFKKCTVIVSITYLSESDLPIHTPMLHHFTWCLHEIYPTGVKVQKHQVNDVAGLSPSASQCYYRNSWPKGPKMLKKVAMFSDEFHSQKTFQFPQPMLQLKCLCFHGDCFNKDSAQCWSKWVQKFWEICGYNKKCFDPSNFSKHFQPSPAKNFQNFSWKPHRRRCGMCRTDLELGERQALTSSGQHGETATDTPIHPQQKKSPRPGWLEEMSMSPTDELLKRPFLRLSQPSED